MSAGFFAGPMRTNASWVRSVLWLASIGLVQAQEPSIESVDRAAASAAAYLVRNTGDDGMFRYRANLDQRVIVDSDYNILRHAGTLYAMSAYYQDYPHEELRSAILRGAGYLRDQAVRPVPDKPDTLAVWSLPEVTGSDGPRLAKLGGTGLGLVGLLGVEKIQPGFTSLSRLRSLGRFVLYMQKPDGSFYSKFIPAQGGRSDAWQSLFYPGEAALGLLILYEHDPAEQWLAAAYKALSFIARSREHDSEVPADHWALLATAQLLSLNSGWVSPPSRSLLLNHAAQICEVMLRAQIGESQPAHLRGGFSPTGETIPAAIYLEGMQAALTFLPQDHPIRERGESAVDRGITFLLNAQIRRGDLAGAFPRAVLAAPDAAQYPRIVDPSVTEVRIDYVQHALSALNQYLRHARGSRRGASLDVHGNPESTKDGYIVTVH